MIRCRLLLTIWAVFAPSLGWAGASVILTPRLESITGKTSVANRALLRTKLTADGGPFSFYLEAFGEAEADQNRRLERRIEDGVFLQEAYVEMKLDSFYVRAGKQAARWSDMWVTPSLDVWTARRWNRFLFDPQPEQLDHPGGVIASYAVEGFSIDAAVISEVSRNRFPQPLPEYLDQRSLEVSGGARVKFDIKSATVGLVAARAGLKDTKGISLNYAFEKFVPKAEFGWVTDHSDLPLIAKEDNFFAVGVDVFLGNWTLQPQATWFDFGDLGQSAQDYQSLFYLSGTWAKNKHDLQFQTFVNSVTEDFFFNVFYAYNWKDWFQAGVFAQSYKGKVGSLFRVYQDSVGENIVGIRLEMNTGL